jgi:hypothetical protein
MDGCAYGAPAVGGILTVIRRCRRASFVECDVEGRGCGRRGRVVVCAEGVDMAKGEGELDDESEQRRLGPNNSI